MRRGPLHNTLDDDLSTITISSFVTYIAFPASQRDAITHEPDWQSKFAQRLVSSIWFPLQTSSPLWLQYRQIAC
jgi:hypothetical protein